MKIYTKTGDGGDTGVMGGERLSKDSPRISAIGDLDELNAAVGCARAADPKAAFDGELLDIQCRLFDIGGELATPRGTPAYSVSSVDICALEESMDRMTESLPPLRAFILPGGSAQAAALHLARTVCRRAERSLLRLHASEPLRETPRVYLNRLSDWLFVAARTANAARSVSEIEWKARKGL